MLKFALLQDHFQQKMSISRILRWKRETLHELGNAKNDQNASGKSKRRTSGKRNYYEADGIESNRKV